MLILCLFSLDCSFSFHLSVSPLLSLSPLLLLLLCVLLSPCCTHLCTINLPTNELEPLTLSLLLSTAAIPYLCSIFLPLSLTQPFCCCSIDRHVISYMNNASSMTKIVALLPSLGWDLFCNSFNWMHLGWFLFSSASYFVKRHRDSDVKVLGNPKPHSYWNRLERVIVRSGCRFIQPLPGQFIRQHPGKPHQQMAVWGKNWILVSSGVCWCASVRCISKCSAFIRQLSQLFKTMGSIAKCTKWSQIKANEQLCRH